MQFFLLLMQYAPLITGLINVAENVSANVAKKPTGQAKLAAVTSAVVQSAPAIGALIAANPEHSNHLENYISGSVAVINSLNAWAQNDSSSGA